MKIKISFLDSELDFSVSNIYSLEVQIKNIYIEFQNCFICLAMILTLTT